MGGNIFYGLISARPQPRPVIETVQLNDENQRLSSDSIAAPAIMLTRNPQLGIAHARKTLLHRDFGVQCYGL